MVPHEGREGFTLLETVIAFLILSTALAISAQTIAIATKSLAGAKERSEILQIFDTLRAEIVPEVLQRGQGAEGTSRSHRWKVDVSPIAGSAGPEGRSGFVVLTVSAPSGRKHKLLHFSSDIGDAR